MIEGEQRTPHGLDPDCDTPCLKPGHEYRPLFCKEDPELIAEVGEAFVGTDSDNTVTAGGQGRLSGNLECCRVRAPDILVTPAPDPLHHLHLEYVLAA